MDERGRLMDLAQAAIGDGITRTTLTRNPDLVYGNTQDLDIQVGVRKDPDHADQVFEHVVQGARLGLYREETSGPSGRALRTIRRRNGTGLTIRMRWSGSSRSSFPRSGPRAPDWTSTSLPESSTA